MSNYQIPKHKCQLCYENVGRFILDCFCVICQECFRPNNNNRAQYCFYCKKPTKGKYLDTKNSETFQKVGHLFSKAQLSIIRSVEIVQFQANIANKYAEYLQKQLKSYKIAVNYLAQQNPKLIKYFKSRIPSFRIKQYQMVAQSKRNHSKNSLPGQNNKNYDHEIYQKRSRTLQSYEIEQQFKKNDFKKINQNRDKRQNSGSIYNLGNINLSTAYKSSKRPSKNKQFYEDNFRRPR